MGRVCMGRVGYGPSLSWAEFVMGRDVQLPSDQNVDLTKAFCTVSRDGFWI